MTTDATHPYLRLLASPLEVLSRLPAIGRLMILTSWGGVTHERIGTLANVVAEGEYAVGSGPDHDCRIHLPRIARMVVDRSPVLNGKAFPRIEFLYDDGGLMFGAVSFAGLEPFDAALEGIATEPVAHEKSGLAFGRGEEIDPSDAALPVLEGLVAAGLPVTVQVERPGFIQRWQGVVEKLTPSKGFINIMSGNFHFHLRAGSVGSWTETGGPGGRILAANAPTGEALGLTVVTPG